MTVHLKGEGGAYQFLRLLQVLRQLSETEEIQFILATHSPQILRAAPPGSILVCEKTTVAPFPTGSAALDLLDGLGALDRMELIPLLQNRRVVFVENRDDRHLIEVFAGKEFGDRKADEILRSWTFRYSYQEPVAANVRDKARQVRDLLSDPSLTPLGNATPTTCLAVGDRDYRRDAEIRKAVRSLKQDQIELFIWRRNEIENYLLDPVALRHALRNELQRLGRSADLRSLAPSLLDVFQQAVEDQRTSAEDAMAAHMHQVDRRLDLTTVLEQARIYLADAWKDGIGWCDAKKVLGALRQWAQRNGLRAQVFSEQNLVAHMDAVPADVSKLLRRLRLAAGRRRTRRK